MEWRDVNGLRDDCAPHLINRTRETDMGIKIHQIHNLVRTYQRVLQPPPPEKVPDSTDRRQDHVSVSAEARQLHEQDAATPVHDCDNKKRSR